MRCSECARALLRLAGPLLALSSHAYAQFDTNLCVVDSALTLQDCGQPCDGEHFTTVAAALDEAEELVAASEIPPSVQVCAFWDQPHFESILIDNEGGRYGAPFKLSFVGGGPTCSDPTADSDAPVVTYMNAFEAPSGPDEIEGLVLDQAIGGACAGPVGPGVLVQGTGLLRINRLLSDGASDFAVKSEGPILEVVGSSIAGCSGAAVDAASSLLLDRTEVAGCRVTPIAPAPGLISVDAAGQMNVSRSVFFGNTVDGASGTSGLLVGQIQTLEQTAFIGNALAGGVPILSTSPSNPLLYLNEVALEGGGPTVAGSVFSRNRHLETLDGVDPAAVVAELLPRGLEACHGVRTDNPFHERAVPGEGLPTSSQPLIEVEGPGVGAYPAFIVYGSFFVENDIEGPLIEVSDPGDGLTIQLLQNTFAANAEASVLNLTARADTSVAVLRNLYSGLAVSGTPLLSIQDAPASVTVSMNVAPAALHWFEGPLEPEWIASPALSFDEISWESAATVREAAPCERFSLVCPSEPDDGCEQWPLSEVPCAVDAAAAYLPSSAFVDSLGFPWPWDTQFFTTSEPGWEAPGATGGPCRVSRGTWDDVENLGWGDGDLSPDAVDCDNDEVTLTPRAPAQDGYATPDCDSSHAPCYVCPPGTEVKGDDDDTLDDDDSRLDDDDSRNDDDSTETPDDDEDSAAGDEHTGCVGGCGFAWRCDEGRPLLGLVGLAILPARRRTFRGRRPGLRSAPS